MSTDIYTNEKVKLKTYVRHPILGIWIIFGVFRTHGICMGTRKLFTQFATYMAGNNYTVCECLGKD